MSERIQKHLARLGHGSRRQIEARLKAGSIVDADGNPYRAGQQVGPGERIFDSGIEVVARKHGKVQARVLAYNKPAGEVSSVFDPRGRPTIYDRLPPCRGGKWVSVGRLDINTTGLILFSNDGDLVHGLTHPSRQVVREYRCRVWGKVGSDTLKRLRNGIRSKNELLRFDEVSFINSAGGANSWYRVVVKRGRNREVRRTWEAAGCKVSRLIRVRFGTVRLARNLAEGSWKELDRTAVNCLIKLSETVRPQHSE